LALLASFAALGLLAVPASAAKLRIHESVRSKSTSAQFDSVTATCPKGEGAISGGYTVPEFSANTGLFFASGSFLGDGGWQASVSQIGDDLEDGFVTSFAYCAKLGKDVVTRGDTTDISNGTFTDLTASCKRKESIISGGWALSTGPDTSALVTRSLKQGKRSWKITGGTTVGTGTLIAIADCVPKKGAPDLVTRKGQGPVSGATSTVTASCRKNEQVVSAGFSSNTVFLPFEFHRGGKRTWGTKGATFGDPGTATVAAYCEKLKKKRKGRR
jgi:hypothetical protein